MTQVKDDELVLFNVYDDPIEASIDKGVLETNGVRCMLANEVMSSVLPLPGSTVGNIRLLVFKKDLKLAKEIMASPAEDTDGYPINEDRDK